LVTNTVTAAEVFPPGEYLRDELEERGWTEKEFAEILGRPVQVVSEILNGRKQVVPETALALGEALGTSAEMWVNLQAAYSLYGARSGRSAETDVTRRSRLRSRLPVTELRQRGWLPDTNDVEALEAAVKDFLGISDLSEEPQLVVAARRSNAEVPLTDQQVAWLARVCRLASSRQAAPFNRSATLALAIDLVHRIHDPTDLGNLEGWLADCGVVLVTLLPLKSSKLDGAVMMLEEGKPVVALTSRGDRMDGYVFTLLHELAHLLLGHLGSTGVRTDDDVLTSTEVEGPEAQANQQAEDWILPEGTLLPAGRPSMSAVLQVAASHRLHTSFVIGRMQRDRKDWALLRRSIPRVRPYVKLES
jgi:HTH-type transcriptional regulator/antitoxin HigA